MSLYFIHAIVRNEDAEIEAQLLRHFLLAKMLLDQLFAVLVVGLDPLALLVGEARARAPHPQPVRHLTNVVNRGVYGFLVLEALDGLFRHGALADDLVDF